MHRFSFGYVFNLFGQILRSIIARSYVKTVWLYKKFPYYFPKWLCHFAFSLTVNESSCCSSSLSAFIVFSLSHLVLLIGIQWYLIVLICSSLMTYGVHFFPVLICHLFVVFYDVSVWIFCLCLNQLICFLIVELLHIFWKHVLYQIHILQVFFFQSVDCIFILLISSTFEG